MGGFSVPAVNLSKVISGAVGRYRQIQQDDEKTEMENRDKYVLHLSKLLDSAEDGETISAINDEIARTLSFPKEKPFKARALQPPSWAKGAGAQGGQSGGQGAATPAPVAAPKGAAGAAGAAGATPQGFDFRRILADLTGEATSGGGGPMGAAMDAGSPDASADPSAVPPQIAQGGAAAVPQGAITPPGVASVASTPPPLTGNPGGIFATASPMLVPPGAQGVMPTPGKNVPEASPLVGSLPGATPPAVQAEMAMGAQGAQGAVPQAVPPAMNMGMGMGEEGMAAVTPTPTSATPAPFPRFMGIRERAELPYQLNDKYGFTRGGTRLGGNLKPLLTVRDVVAAAKEDYDIKQVPVSDQYPLGLALTPKADADLSLLAKAKLDLTKMRSASISKRDNLAEINAEIARDRLALSKEKNEQVLGQHKIDTTIKVGQNYKKSVDFYTQAVMNLASVEARLDEATGPADYMAILETVHAIDNTAAREGEVATYRGASAIFDRLEQMFSRATEGDLLNGTTREQMRAALRAGIEAMAPVKQEIDQQYAHMAREWKLDPVAIKLPPEYHSWVLTGAGAPAAPAGPSATGTATSITQQQWDALLALKRPDGSPKWTPETLKAKGITVGAASASSPPATPPNSPR